MQYVDRIYGPCAISHPLIVELIESPSLQRLKGVDQAGYFEPFHRGLRYSRFEHSLGVMLLLQRYQSNLEEQVAGLLHDASHSAFSHCIDYVSDLGSPETHSRQDDILVDFLDKTEIPGILAAHGLDFAAVMNHNRHPLLESALPDLSADRLDYSLRTALVAGEIEQADAERFLACLEVQRDHWIFGSEECARDYANLFSLLNEKYFAGLASAVMFYTVGSYLTYALDRKYISIEDLYTTDLSVLNKISPVHGRDPMLLALYRRMTCQTEYFEAHDSSAARVFCKSRVVDPLCRSRRNIKRLSELDPQWQATVAEQSRPREYRIGFHDDLPYELRR